MKIFRDRSDAGRQLGERLRRQPLNGTPIVFGLPRGGVPVKDVLDMLCLTADSLQTIRAAEPEELARRERAYRGERPPPEIGGKSVIIVDDGVATGATTVAAVRAS
jgi:predicted phosphoribosyltransferase